MFEIAQSLRTLLIDLLSPTQPLQNNLAVGDTLILIPNTSRYRIGDQIYFLSVASNLKETALISDIPDDKTLVISPGTTRGWTTAENTLVIKATNNQLLAGVYIGDLKMIPSFPSITIEFENESNEWFTLRQTSHEYRFRIRIYVQDDNFETTNINLAKLATQVREILLDHIRPIIEGVPFALLADLPAGQTIVNVADTSRFIVGGPVFIQDNNPRPSQQESYVKKILSPTALEINFPTEFDYLVSRGAQITFVKRLLYDSRPESINYGVINKGGTFLRAAEITWFSKEMKIREGNILV